MNQNEQTHDIFFKYLSKKKLNELLLRSDRTENRKILQDEINKRLKGVSKLVAQTNISDDGNYFCSLYINFINVNNEQVGHISFHFSPRISDKKRTQLSNLGRAHGKNNKNKLRNYTIRFDKTEDSIKMSISKYALPIRQELKECVNISLEVLNNYFDPNLNYFLGNKEFSNIEHKCYKYIVSQMAKSKTPISNTRKRRP